MKEPDSSVSSNGLDSRGSIPGRESTASRPALGPIQPPIQWVLSPAVKRQGREADHSPPSSAKVKNGGAITPSSMPSCCGT
jgi:hypothetical protein